MRLPELDPDISRVLMDFQRQPAAQLARALECGAEEWGYPGAVDLSVVGSGKSYMDAAAALNTGRRPVVLCPTVGQAGWEDTFKVFGREPGFIGTYEAVRGGWRPQIGAPQGRFFRWKNPHEIVLILDEAQMVKGQESMTTAMVGGAILDKIPIIAASATIASSPLEMRIAGRITGLHQGGPDWKRFLLEKGCRYIEGEERWIWQPRNRTEILADINETLIPWRGCRIKKEDLGERPKSEIRLLPLSCPQADEINSDWHELQEKIKGMESARDDRGNPRYPKEVILNMRRAGRVKNWKKTELALVPIVAPLVKKCLEEGKSVVCFFSYTASRLAMGKLLKTKAGFYGGQNPVQRRRIMEAFQANRERVLLCNIGSGGASVSLHDLTGERPRETFIFPSDNPVKMGQAPGRIDRLGVKTPSIQWVPYIKGGLLEDIVKSTVRKMAQTDVLNNGSNQGSLPILRRRAA